MNTALKYPQHLRGVIISNMVASVPRYEAYVARFKNELTPDDRKTLEKVRSRRQLRRARIPEDRLRTHLHQAHLPPGSLARAG